MHLFSQQRELNSLSPQGISTFLGDQECTLGMCLGICSEASVIACEGGRGRMGASGASPSPIGT